VWNRRLRCELAAALPGAHARCGARPRIGADEPSSTLGTGGQEKLEATRSRAARHHDKNARRLHWAQAWHARRAARPAARRSEVPPGHAGFAARARPLASAARGTSHSRRSHDNAAGRRRGVASRTRTRKRKGAGPSALCFRALTGASYVCSTDFCAQRRTRLAEAAAREHKSVAQSASIRTG
jgi:hypothetical protein